MSIETFSPTIAVATTAYAAGNLIGSKLALPNCLGKGNYSAWLEGLVVLDRGNQKAAIDLVLFNADPAATTFADNTAFAVNPADAGKVIGLVSVLAGDYVSIATTLAVATKKDFRMALKNTTSSPTLYAALVCRGTPTYTATTNLTLQLTVCK